MILAAELYEDAKFLTDFGRHQKAQSNYKRVFVSTLKYSFVGNLLIKADNTNALKFLINQRNLKGKIDLIYIDQPFATNGNFTITDGRATTISNSKKW